jgi:SAM-dependent methyltransferase
LRESIKHLVRIVAETLPIREPIYEFGSLQVPGQEGFADLRPIFGGKEYVGCDMREGLGVDKVLDLHHIELPDAIAGTVLILDTLEHVEYPHVAMDEAHRITKSQGTVLISSVMDFPIHEYPYDYWRFTPEAFKSLLRKFDRSYVDFAGDPELPHTVFGVGFKGSADVNDVFLSRIIEWKRQWYYVEGWNWRQFKALLTPPWVAMLKKHIKKKLRP